MIDYQIQTTASDGKFSPRECVKMAHENGLISIAITDHDTVGGIPEALEAGKEFGIEVIPGIEITCQHQQWGIHILGFGIDISNLKLANQLVEMKSGREKRAEIAIEKLQAYGFSINFESILERANGSVITRPHIAEEIMDRPENQAKLRNESIISRQDLFDAYLADEAPNSVFSSHSRLTPKEAAELIHNAGGAAIWSHPFIPICKTVVEKAELYPLIEKILGDFLDSGVDGLEVFSGFNEDGTEFLYGLAEKYGVLKTAGSDFHDTYVDPRKLEEGSSFIGGVASYGYSLDGIREALLAAIEKQRAGVASV